MSFKLVNATSSSSRIFFSLCLSLFWQRRNDGARTQTSAPRGAICNADARNESKRELKRLLFFHPSSLRTHHKKANKRRQKEREKRNFDVCAHQFLRVPSHSIEHSSHPVRLREPSLVRGHARTRKFVRDRQFERFVGEVQRARVFEVRQGHFLLLVYFMCLNALKTEENSGKKKWSLRSSVLLLLHRASSPVRQRRGREEEETTDAREEDGEWLLVRLLRVRRARNDARAIPTNTTTVECFSHRSSRLPRSF